MSEQLKWKGQEKEYMKTYMRSYRKRERQQRQWMQNRIAYLELEVERLRKQGEAS